MKPLSPHNFISDGNFIFPPFSLVSLWTSFFVLFAFHNQSWFITKNFILMLKHFCCSVVIFCLLVPRGSQRGSENFILVLKHFCISVVIFWCQRQSLRGTNIGFSFGFWTVLVSIFKKFWFWFLCLRNISEKLRLWFIVSVCWIHEGLRKMFYKFLRSNIAICLYPPSSICLLKYCHAGLDWQFFSNF